MSEVLQQESPDMIVEVPNTVEELLGGTVVPFGAELMVEPQPDESNKWTATSDGVLQRIDD